jgi:hypothetical protein
MVPPPLSTTDQATVVVTGLEMTAVKVRVPLTVRGPVGPLMDTLYTGAGAPPPPEQAISNREKSPTVRAAKVGKDRRLIKAPG